MLVLVHVGCPGGVGAPDDDYMLGPTINNTTIAATV